MSLPDDRFVASETFYIRYAETDAMGIVHHSNYVVFFEEARSVYGRQRGSPYSEFEKTGHYLTVAEVNIRYVQPSVYEQQVTIYAWINEMKSRSIVFGYELHDTQTGQLLVSGTTKHICITKDGKVARIPDAWRINWAD